MSLLIKSGLSGLVSNQKGKKWTQARAVIADIGRKEFLSVLIPALLFLNRNKYVKELKELLRNLQKEEVYKYLLGEEAELVPLVFCLCCALVTVGDARVALDIVKSKLLHQAFRAIPGHTWCLFAQIIAQDHDHHHRHPQFQKQIKRNILQHLNFTYPHNLLSSALFGNFHLVTPHHSSLELAIKQYYPLFKQLPLSSLLPLLLAIANICYLRNRVTPLDKK